MSGVFDPSGSIKPTNDQTVEQIKAYMDKHKIAYTSSMAKTDLLKAVNGDAG